MPSSTASVSGRRNGEGRAPCRGSEVIEMRPPSAWMRAADHVHADAAAGQVGHRRGRRKARQEEQIVDLARPRAAPRGDQSPCRWRCARTFGRSMPPPSSDDLDDDPARPVLPRSGVRCLPGLAGGEPFLGRFKSVVDGVADHVGQRIGEPFDHGLVDLGVFALGDRGAPSCRSPPKLRARCATCAGTAT